MASRYVHLLESKLHWFGPGEFDAFTETRCGSRRTAAEVAREPERYAGPTTCRRCLARLEADYREYLESDGPAYDARVRRGEEEREIARLGGAGW